MMNTFILFFIIILIASFTANIIIKNSTFYASLFETNILRDKSLDAFRGFLAIGVFVYHSNLTFFYYKNNEWGGVDNMNNLWNILGNGSVYLFFIITGYLFFGNIIKKDGLPKVVVFFRQRIKRLLPMFLFSLLLIFCVAVFQSPFTINEIMFNLYNKFLYILHISTNNVNVTGIDNMSIINAGVFWSLVYEAKFYIMLPIISYFYISGFKKSEYLLLVLFTLSFFLGSTLWSLFILGMLVALIKQKYDFKLAKRYIVMMILISLILLYIIPNNNYIMNILLFVVFTLIFGFSNISFDLLQYKGLQLLGTISYSIYLLHGILLWITFQFLYKYLNLSLTYEEHFTIVGILTMFVVYFSSLSFRHVEYRFHRY